MKNVVADTGSLISLGIAGQIEVIESVFDRLHIAGAVYEELRNYVNP